MNILQPWNTVYFVGFVIFAVTRGVFAQRAEREKKTIDLLDGQAKALLGFVAGVRRFPDTRVDSLDLHGVHG